jgi:hypothetical protein
MGRIRSIITKKEIREAIPSTIFFVFLFHLIALTRAVSQDDYNIPTLRAAGATGGALIVAKAILVVNALPMSRLFPERRVVQILKNQLS